MKYEVWPTGDGSHRHGDGCLEMAVTGMGTGALSSPSLPPTRVSWKGTSADNKGKQSAILPSGGASALNARARLGQLGYTRRAADLSPSPELCESDGTVEPASLGRVTLRPSTASLRVPGALRRGGHTWNTPCYPRQMGTSDKGRVTRRGKALVTSSWE